jgi:hypothetical protein
MWKYALAVIFSLVLLLSICILDLFAVPWQGVVTLGLLGTILAFVLAIRAWNLFFRLGQPVTLDKLQKRVWYIVEGVVDLTDTKDGFVQIAILRNANTTESIKSCVAIKLTEKLPESFIKSGFYVNTHFASRSDMVSLVSKQQDDKKEIIVMPVRRDK